MYTVSIRKKRTHWFFCNKIYCKGKFCYAQRFYVLGITFPRNTPVQTEVPSTASEQLSFKEKLAMVLQPNEKPAQ